MNIKGFKIKNQKIQNLWIILSFTFSVAVILIVFSFYAVFKRSDESYSKEELFTYNTYYSKYKVVTYSNKNQNTYEIEEYCLRNDSDTKFRFNTLNSDNNYSYIVTKDYFSIKSDNQINQINNLINNRYNANILSVSTFIDIYSKINVIIENNLFKENYGIITKVEEKDSYIIYNINLTDIDNLDEDSLENSNSLNAYIKELSGQMKISKLELILDKNTNIPVEYIVYTDNNKAYIDITYNEFKINSKFEEKVFSF